MPGFVTPQTYLVGYSAVDWDGLQAYLKDTGNEDFYQSVVAARTAGLADGEILASFYAKLCYASLTIGKNANVTRVRDIPDNLVACFTAGHGSVFGHCNINFITTSCSRVFTHELVRNHIGTEYSQTSGRYVRLDQIKMILDPILDDCRDLAESALDKMEETIYLIECRKGLRKPNPDWPAARPLDHKEFFRAKQLVEAAGRTWPLHDDAEAGRIYDAMKWIPNNDLPFAFKKQVTSAARRLAPNGQTNEMGWSINLRALRHVIQMRTSAHAEWEIRYVMNQVYRLVKKKFPLIFHGARTREVNGLLEVYGMRTQPYTLSDEEVLRGATVNELRDELERRGEQS